MPKFLYFFIGILAGFIATPSVRFIDKRKDLTIFQKIIAYILISLLILLIAYLIYKYLQTPGVTEEIEIK